MNIMLSAEGDTVSSAFRSFFTNVGDAVRAFSWRDAIDLVLLFAFFYIAFRFLKSKKSASLLLGVAGMAVLYGVARLLHLTGVTYLLSGAFRYGPLAVLILFQPEIREFLEKLGSGSVNGILSVGDQKKKKALYAKAIDNICSAVDSLAASKTGALIAVSGSASLDEIVKSGIVIDAEVNEFLLRNLFFNKAPLHDGAVVINNARIEAAGCLLPLTRRNDVDSNLGTRHRAALGLSEISDAIVIVVSEETGVISVAYDCSLSRGYTQESLKRFLQKKILRNVGKENSPDKSKTETV